MLGWAIRPTFGEPLIRGQTMQQLLDGLRQFAIDFSRNAFFRALGYGIIFSLIMTFVIGNIVGVFELKPTFPYFTAREAQPFAYWIGIIFVSFSLLFAFFGYVSDLNSR